MKKPEELEQLQYAAGRLVDILYHGTAAEEICLLAEINPEQVVFYFKGESREKTLDMVISAACTIALMADDTEAEAFDKVTTLLMTKFNEMKDYTVAEAEEEEDDESAPSH